MATNNVSSSATNQEKLLFINAIEAAYNVLVLSGFYPAVNITSEPQGVFSVSWYGFDNSLNTLAFWTDENIGLYSSHRDGETLHCEDLNVEEFFSLCYKD